MSFRLKLRPEPTGGRNVAAKNYNSGTQPPQHTPILPWSDWNPALQSARGWRRRWKRPNTLPARRENGGPDCQSLLHVLHRASICLPSDTFTRTELGLGQSPSSVPGLMKVAIAVVIRINKCYCTLSASDKWVSPETSEKLHVLHFCIYICTHIKHTQYREHYNHPA